MLVELLVTFLLYNFVSFRQLIQIMEQLKAKDNVLCCSECRQSVTHSQHIIRVPGAEGEIGAYVNPHG